MKITLDEEKCIGCGTCVAMAPNTFKFKDNGKAEVIAEEGAPGEEEGIKASISACPVQVIKAE